MKLRFNRKIMNPKKLSGSEYKKRRLEKEAEAISNTRKIGSFFARKHGLYFIEMLQSALKMKMLYLFYFEDNDIDESNQTLPTIECNDSSSNETLAAIEINENSPSLPTFDLVSG